MGKQVQDKKVSVSVSLACLLAWTAWVVAFALLVVGTITQREEFGYFGLATSAAAVTLHIRAFCIKLNRNIRTAYEMGREDSVRSIR